MSPITTHVLDTSRGRPAEGVPVALKVRAPEGSWKTIAAGKTDSEGRIADLLPKSARLKKGFYRMAFETAAYYRSVGLEGFYPVVIVTFEVREPAQHYHIPLLLSPYGYSTYRGS